MGRKSTIDKLPPQVKSRIEKHMRENRLTLNEIIHDLQQQFPEAAKPSRSALGRYKQNIEELVGRTRDIQDAAEYFVGELGEDANDKAGALMAQAVTTLLANVSLKANDPEKEISIKDAGELARAARAAMQTRTMSIKERQLVEEAARKKLLQEQEKRLAEVRGSDGMSEELENRIRGILLGKS